jgi:hypothetical protein
MRVNTWIAISFALCATIAATSTGAEAQSHNFKVVEEKGHLSPVGIRITYPNGRSRNVMLAGVGNNSYDTYNTHQLVVRSDGGASQRTLWLDSIGAIQGTSAMRTYTDEFVMLLKDGQRVQSMFSGSNVLGCSGEPSSADNACSVLYIRNEDDGMEKLDLRKVQTVEFNAPPRKDRAGNVMFDLWRYSPFTGERIQ